jgi:hypothetical protein
VVVSQFVLRLSQSCPLRFVCLRYLHERTHSVDRVGPKIEPLAVHALVSETAVQLAFNDVATFEDGEQLERHW